MLAVFFFVSGFCSLLYQIVWLRLAMGYFGVIAPILSTVLSVFMLGLGFGAWASGRWLSSARASRLTPSFLLSLYGFLEGLAAAGSFAVPSLFAVFDAHASSGMGTGPYFASSALIILVSLGVPCVALGATTPTVLAYARARGWETTHRFSWLYLANLFGALAGALLTPFILIETFGFHKTLILGVMLQALVSVSALMLGMKKSLDRHPGNLSDPAPSALPACRQAQGNDERKIVAALFSTGFVSMACEVVWTRLFTPVLGTTIYAFAGILAVYLAMHAVGVSAYRRWGRFTSPSVNAWVLASLPFAVLLPLYINQSLFPTTSVRVLGGLAPFCALLGWLTPGWVDRVSHGDPRRAGTAYGVNILGCVLGPLCAGYFLLPGWGAKASLIFLAGLLWIAAMVMAPRAGTALFGIVSMAGALRCQSIEIPLSRLAVIRRDYMATVVSMGQGIDKKLYVNGIGITVLTPLTKMMVHLPVLSHQGPPRSALVICFGMGTAFRSLCRWGLDTTAVELVPSVRDAFGYYYDDAADILRQPNQRIMIDDGRRFLKRTNQRYDIITLDPPPPVEAAASGLLYSREFYAAAKMHLAPGGVLQQWWPRGEAAILQSVTRTFMEAFPYVRIYKGIGGLGYHFLGSLTPLRPLSAQDVQRMPEAVQQDIKEWTTGRSTQSLWSQVIAHEISPQTLLRQDVLPLTDDHPFNEYFFLRRRKARRENTYREVV